MSRPSDPPVLPALLPSPRDRALALAQTMLEEDRSTGQLRDLIPGYLDTITRLRLGAPTARPKEIMIVGGGISGLVAAILLGHAGHRVTILEANGDRLGGRIKTFRGPKLDGPVKPIDALAASDAAKPLYGEAGAMRIPDIHPLTLALIDRLKLPRRPFYNNDVSMNGPLDLRTPPVVYRSPLADVPEWRNGADLNPPYAPPKPEGGRVIATNGQRALRSVYTNAPAAINTGFEGTWGQEKYCPTSKILEDAWAHVKDEYSDIDANGQRVPKPGPEYVAGWARVIARYDRLSLRDFLSQEAGLSDANIAALGVIEGFGARLPLSFMHTFTRVSTKTYWEIADGMDRLITALAVLIVTELRGRVKIRMNARLVKLEEIDGGRRLRAHLREEPKDICEGEDPAASDEAAPKPEEADLAILTIPFSSLRLVELPPSTSYEKRRSIAEMHYDAATKVLLRFSKKWWEEAGAAPGAPAVRGGYSVTDMPNMGIYYPSFGNESGRGGEPDNGGVLLATYCWADDARRWDSLHPSERGAFALRVVEKVHDRDLKALVTGQATQSWARDPYAFGEAAVYFAGQLSRIHLASMTVEGRVHFAGEHTSLKHAWIEGALESAIRAAREVSAAADRDDA